MGWDWNVTVIVPSEVLDAAEAVARNVNESPYEGQAFNLRLSSDGSEPPTHYGLHTAADERMLAAMESAMPTLAGVLYWTSDTDGSLIASNATEATRQAWGLAESLEAAGLRVAARPKPVAEVP